MSERWHQRSSESLRLGPVGGGGGEGAPQVGLTAGPSLRIAGCWNRALHEGLLATGFPLSRGRGLELPPEAHLGLTGEARGPHGYSDESQKCVIDWEQEPSQETCIRTLI